MKASTKHVQKINNNNKENHVPFYTTAEIVWKIVYYEQQKKISYFAFYPDEYCKNKFKVVKRHRKKIFMLLTKTINLFFSVKTKLQLIFNA